MGTPNNDTWPGVTSFKDWNPHFPMWPPLTLKNYFRTPDEYGLDLLEVRRRRRTKLTSDL